MFKKDTSISDSPVVLFGARRQGISLANQMSSQGASVMGFLDPVEREEIEESDFEWLGDDSEIKSIVENNEGTKFFVVVNVSGKGKRDIRQTIYEHASETEAEAGSFMHKTAFFDSTASAEGGVIISAMATVQPHVCLGKNVLVNTSASIDHDVHVGKHSVIGPKACLCGGVHIGKNSHVGPGAVMTDNVRLGKESVIGAGSVVTSDIPPKSVAYGVPAKKIRSIEGKS